jgi:hypothetical protein
MGWLELTIIDDRHQRTKTVRGPTWIFATAAEDPKDIPEFVEAEKTLGGYSEFEHDKRKFAAVLRAGKSLLDDASWRFAKPYLQRNAGKTDLTLLETLAENIDGERTSWERLRNALKRELYTSQPASTPYSPRSSDNGGSVFVDMRDKTITVKGHLADRHDPHPKGAKLHGKRWARRGELLYLDYDFISDLRTGVAGYSQDLGAKLLPIRLFANDAMRYREAHPRHPTKEHPSIIWIPDTVQLYKYFKAIDYNEEIMAKSERTVVAHGSAHWQTSYRLPSSWTIVDGTKNKVY